MPKSGEKYCQMCHTYKDLFEFELKSHGGGARKKYCNMCTPKGPRYYGKKFPNQGKTSFYEEQKAKYNKGKDKDAQI